MNGAVGFIQIRLSELAVANNSLPMPAAAIENKTWMALANCVANCGSTPVEAPAIFERLGIDADAWSQMVKDFGRMFKNVAGKSTSIEQARSLKTRRKFYCARV